MARIVAIDARMVEAVPHGVARYVTRLASGLAALKKTHPLSYEPVFLVSSDLGRSEFEGFRAVACSSAYLSARELVELPRLLRQLGASLYHSPSFSSLRPGSLDCPWIVTVHDLNHLRFGNWRQHLYYRCLLKPFVKKAAAVATVSEFSRREIAQWSGLSAEAIEVVPNALEPSLAERPAEDELGEVLGRLGLVAGAYFFCLSNPKPHKNLSTLVQAYRELGDPSWPLALSVHEHGDVDGVRALGPLGDREVRALRAAAGAVIFPSLYEGFGLPPVEAAIAGVPLVVSKIPPHQEGLVDLAAGEALWVDPADRAGWREALREARAGKVSASAPSTRQRILARFTEASLSRHMDRIYRRVLQGV